MIFVVSPLYEWRTRPDDTDGFLTTATPIERFMFDEGTGDTVAGDRHDPAIAGTVSNLQWLPNAGNDEVVISSKFSPVKRIKRSSTILNDQDCIKQRD
jgi:hypothetical protein